MPGTLPGTTIEISSLEKDGARHVFSHIFSAGGVVLSQISRMTGLEPHTIQNWVKRGYLSPPQHRQYSERQFVRVVIINLLRQSLQLDEITDLLSYINGKLSDEADDAVDDPTLYHMFCNVLCAIGERSVARKYHAVVLLLSKQKLTSCAKRDHLLTIWRVVGAKRRKLAEKAPVRER